MKSLLIFLLGAVIGAFAYSVYTTRDAKSLPRVETTSPTPNTGTDHPTLGEHPSDTATDLKDRLAAKAKEWHLTPEEIQRELQQSGKVAREKASVAGDKVADARIITVIKGKYVLDRDLSAMDIDVDCTDGKVTLTGSVASVDLISKALVLAMDTTGVVSVTSNLTTGS
jgi:osmotically-inducible protein OsmY